LEGSRTSHNIAEVTKINPIANLQLEQALFQPANHERNLEPQQTGLEEGAIQSGHGQVSVPFKDHDLGHTTSSYHHRLRLIAMFNNTWSPENEAGIVNLGVAENTLMVRTNLESYGLWNNN